MSPWKCMHQNTHVKYFGCIAGHSYLFVVVAIPEHFHFCWKLQNKTRIPWHTTPALSLLGLSTKHITIFMIKWNKINFGPNSLKFFEDFRKLTLMIESMRLFKELSHFPIFYYNYSSNHLHIKHILPGYIIISLKIW